MFLKAFRGLSGLMVIAGGFWISGCSTVIPMEEVDRTREPVIDTAGYSEGAKIAFEYGFVNKKELDQIVRDLKKAEIRQKEVREKNERKSIGVTSEGVRNATLLGGLATLNPTTVLFSSPVSMGGGGEPVYPVHALSHNFIFVKAPESIQTQKQFWAAYKDDFYRALRKTFEDNGVKVLDGVNASTGKPLSYVDDTQIYITVPFGLCDRDKTFGCRDYSGLNLGSVSKKISSSAGVFFVVEVHDYSNTLARAFVNNLPGFHYWSGAIQNGGSNHFLIDGKQYTFEELFVGIGSREYQ